MALAVEGRNWNSVRDEVRSVLGQVGVEWPGDTPRPSSPNPRVLLDCSGVVRRIEMPSMPRYPFEIPLGTSQEALRRLQPAS